VGAERTKVAITTPQPAERSSTVGARVEAPAPQSEVQRALAKRPFSRLQLKLRVGAPSDVHEREADRVADQVMRVPEGGSTEAAESDQRQVRRRCRHCEESHRRQDDEPIRRKRADVSAPAGGESAIDDSTLTSGGAPLPDGVRTFYETRFDRDFSGVRVHTGPLAERFSDALHAEAFTYSRHVWMGRGNPVTTSRLLAHELAHVVQQGPGPSSDRNRGRRDVDTPADPEQVIRRFTPYWEPYEYNGDKNHDLVLPAMSRENKIFVEAPVPNADKLSEGFHKQGRADLLRASTTVGLYFTAHATPAALKSHRGLKKDGERFDHQGNSAPQTDGARFVRNAANAPTKVEVGDLKPSHGTLEAAEGPGQLHSYSKGFELVQKEARAPGTLGDGADWTSMNARIFGKNDLTVPKQFKHPKFEGQTTMKLVLKQFGARPYDPKPPVRGHICVQPDQVNGGVWNYTWVPSTAPKEADLPKKVSDLGPKVVKQVIDPLSHSPLTPAKKPRPGVPALERPAPDTGVIRAKGKAVAPEKDSFDHDKWTKDRAELGKEFDAEAKTQAFKDVKGQLLAARAHEAIRQRFGLALPEVTSAKDATRSLDKIEFWTGAIARPIGFFRRVFGTAFVKVAQLFVRMRDRIREALKGRRSHVGAKSGFLGAALKAAFRVMKMAAAFVIGQVTDRLMQSLVTGVTEKLKSMIAPEFQEELALKAQELEKLKDELERKAVDTVEALLGKTLGRHLEDLKKIDEVYNLVGDIATVINWVRWGARVVACASPPAFGCLWILAEGLLDFAAQKVAETCWFQEKIAPLFTKVRYLTTELPKALADGIIGKVRDFLPASLHDIFSTRETGDVILTAADIECDESDTTRYEPHPLHQDLDALYLKIGEERALALSEVARQTGARDRPLTNAELVKLGDAIVEHGVTAEQLQAYAKNYPTAPSTMPADISKFIEQVKSGKPPEPGATAETPAPTPEEEAKKIEGPAKGPDEGAQGGETTTEPGGEGGVKVVDAASRRSTRQGGKTLDDVLVQVVNQASGHTQGTTPLIHVMVYLKRKPLLMIKGIETVVVKRELVPEKAKSLDEALGLVVHYGPKFATSVEEVNGFIPSYDPKRAKETSLLGLILTRQGQQLVDRVNQQRAAQASGSPAPAK